MKKLTIPLLLFCTTAQAGEHEFYTAKQVGEGMKTHFSEVDDVKNRILRRAELQDTINVANLKIAAFEVELAKAKLEKAVADSAMRRLESEGNK